LETWGGNDPTPQTTPISLLETGWDPETWDPSPRKSEPLDYIPPAKLPSTGADITKISRNHRYKNFHVLYITMVLLGAVTLVWHRYSNKA
jgi:hypothetical protein